MIYRYSSTELNVKRWQHKRGITRARGIGSERKGYLKKAGNMEYIEMELKEAISCGKEHGERRTMAKALHGEWFPLKLNLMFIW